MLRCEAISPRSRAADTAECGTEVSQLKESRWSPSGGSSSSSPWPLPWAASSTSTTRINKDAEHCVRRALTKCVGPLPSVGHHALKIGGCAVDEEVPAPHGSRPGSPPRSNRRQSSVTTFSRAPRSASTRAKPMPMTSRTSLCASGLAPMRRSGETRQNLPSEIREPPLDGVRPFPAPQYASAADGARCRRASRGAQAQPNRPLAARHQPNDGRGSQSPTVHAGTERQMLNWGWRDARATLIRRV